MRYNGSAIAPPPTHNGPSPTTSRPDGDGPILRTPPTGVPFEFNKYKYTNISIYKAKLVIVKNRTTTWS